MSDWLHEILWCEADKGHGSFTVYTSPIGWKCPKCEAEVEAASKRVLEKLRANGTIPEKDKKC